MLRPVGAALAEAFGQEADEGGGGVVVEGGAVAGGVVVVQQRGGELLQAGIGVARVGSPWLWQGALRTRARPSWVRAMRARRRSLCAGLMV